MMRRATTHEVLLLLMAVLMVSVPGCSEDGSNDGAADADQQKNAMPFVPHDTELIVRNNRGVGQMGKFEYRAAHDTFQQLIDEHPNWLEVKVNLAIATFNRQKEGDQKRGLDLLQEVLDIEPENLRATYCVAVLKQFQGDPDSARPLFERVAAADPLDAYAAYFTGQCYEGRDEEQALHWYLRAIEIDPYLRSGYYRAFQKLQRLDRRDEAISHLGTFQKLAKNPQARLVEMKYTRMGPKATAQTVDLAPTTSTVPQGPIFQPPTSLIDQSSDLTWRESFDGDPPSITACDINDDGRIDLFLSNALGGADDVRNLVLMQNAAGAFDIENDHPLARVSDVLAALWGDYDNDGRTDVYLCRRGMNQLWRQSEDGEWEDVTAATGTANGEATTVGGAMFDADHDGDLDIFCINNDAPNELLNNNLDGTFRPIAADQQIAGTGGASRQILPVDLDRDRDLDLIVINESPPHEIYLNDRLWSYRPVQGMDDIRMADVVYMVAADRDADGATELYGVTSDGGVIGWSPEQSGSWTQILDLPSNESEPVDAGPQLGLLDIRGDGKQQILRSRSSGMLLEDGSTLALGEWSNGTRWAPVVLDPSSGPALVIVSPNSAPHIALPGSGRHTYAALTFSGRVKDAESMRSNASGIGTLAAARIGSSWLVRTGLADFAGPGQSLEPIPIGMNGAARIDFVSIDWSDGVFQSELDLAAGSLHAITETQRQLSSCPVLFAWNGEKFEFISDLLGVGGIGYMVAPHEYAPPRPWERFLLPEGSLAPRDGRYLLKLTEPMEEVCYLDSAALEVFDLPPGWNVVIDDRMNINGPEPTGEPIFFREEQLPVAAFNDRGMNVLESIAERDLVAAPVGEIDQRFIGRLMNMHVLTLEFDSALDSGAGSPVLVIDGWVEYPYSQTMFAAWQANAAYLAPTLEARTSDGTWHVVQEQFGYPAGMPRRMALPLPDLPTGTRALRLSTNQEVYWDRISVVTAEPCPQARSVILQPVRADLSESWFPKRTTGDQRLPYYDYDNRAPMWDTRWPAGWYTEHGRMTELVTQTDGGLAIFGPGEEIHFEFDMPDAEVPPGWSRRIVLNIEGWCKDMDIFTQDGETVEPLPVHPSPNSRAHENQRRLNTRYQSGK